MPSISTMVYPAPAYVRVEANWADVNAAKRAAVYRVDCVTGERVPLRPYVSYDGDFLDLSCGYGIWWDTEAPLDRCVYYCTQAQDTDGDVITIPPNPPLVYSFSTNIVDGWGPTDTGQAVALSGGTNPGNYDATGGVGTQANDTVNVLRYSFADPELPNQDIYIDTMLAIASAPNGDATTWIIGRFADTSNYYLMRQHLNASSVVTIELGKRVGGTLVILTGAITVNPVHTGGTWYRNRFQVWGNQLRGKCWKRTDPEPTDWQITFTDSAPLNFGTNTALASRLESGNTNTLPVIFSFDNWIVSDPCTDPVTVEQCSDDLVVPSSGDFRFGDPVRPCHDVTLQLVGEVGPDCVPTQGVFFGNMAEETSAANSGAFQPVNAEFPIVTNRTRSGLTSTLTVASRTFADRDAMRTLAKPGSALLLRGPGQYGIDDRYMSVGDTSESRPVSDHKVQPRIIAVPHTEVARPSGPTQGVCGTRVEDLSDLYPTWDAVVAAGLTWADLLRGKASSSTPKPATVERTWADVNSQYANWNAVNAGNADWDDLEDGA